MISQNANITRILGSLSPEEVGPTKTRTRSLRKPLWKNVGPGELVWRQGTLWLMAACRWERQYDVPGSVLRFGEVDWSDANPQVHMITQETHIGEWMKWISDG